MLRQQPWPTELGSARSLRRARAAWVSMCLWLLAPIQAIAQPGDVEPQTRKIRVSFGSFKSTAPRLTTKALLDPLTFALETAVDVEGAPKVVLVKDAGAAAEVSVSAGIGKVGPKYQVTFLLTSTDDPSLRITVPFVLVGPRVGSSAAKLMAKGLADAARQLDAKRRESVERAKAAQPAEATPPEEAPAAGSTEVEGEEEPDPFFRPSLRGFAQALGVATSFDKDALLAGIAGLRSTPRAFLQGNLQPQLKTRGDHFTLAGDFSVYGSTSAPNGLVLVNELSADAHYGPVRVMVGRRRVVWGSGLAVNPTDVLNPVKDPLTPDLQRTGAFYLPMVDVTVGPLIVTGFMSMGVDTNRWALPKGLQTKKLVFGGRVYALIAGVDLNVMYYRDQDLDRHLVGLAASRFITDNLELHVEGLFRSGAPEGPPIPAVPACGETVAAPSGTVSGTALIGARVHFDDQSRLIAEYLYDRNGLDGAGYDKLRALAGCFATAVRAAGGPTAPGPPDHPVGFPAEQLFLVRAHHIFLNYDRQHLTTGLFEDVSVSAGAVISPVDFSAILQAGIGYSFSGRTVLTARVMYWAGGKESEMGAWPARVLGMAGIRTSF